MLAVDYSYARPNPAAIKAAGYTAVLRYYSGGTAGKDLTAAEARSLLDAGLSVGVVWETTAQRSLGGAAAGTADGKAALAQARRVGQPAGTLLAANLADFAPTAGQVPTIVAYYKAFTAQIAGYAHGAYGTGYLIDQLVAHGCTGIFWQNAMNDEGDSGSVISSHAHVYQRVKATRTIAGCPAGQFDEDVLLADIPLWSSNPAPTPPEPDPPAPTPPSINLLEDDMLVITYPGPKATEAYLIADGKAAQLMTTAAITALTKAGVPRADLDAASAQNIIQKFA